MLQLKQNKTKQKTLKKKKKKVSAYSLGEYV